MPERSPGAGQLAAEAWAEVCDLLDLQFFPLGLHAIDALAPRPGDSVADIGCGAGQSPLQLAERVGRQGRVIGIDIAPLLLDLARQRAASFSQIQFIECDAQTIDFPAASLDSVFSRFGVMAFADPRAAFANFHRMLKPSGQLAFVCWRSLAENDLDLVPLRAAGLEQQIDPTPFSFEDPVYLREVLTGAGFRRIGIEAHDEKVSSGGVDAMAAVLLRVGPLGKILRETPTLREVAEPRVRKALAARAEHGRVALNAAVWIVTAHA